MSSSQKREGSVSYFYKWSVSASHHCHLCPFAPLVNGVFSLFWLTFITDLCRNRINSCYIFFNTIFSQRRKKNVFFILSDPLHELTYCGSCDSRGAEPQCFFCVVARPDSGATSCWKDGLTDSARGNNLQLFQWPYRLCLLSSALESPGYWLERFIALSSILIFLLLFI